MAVYLVCNSYDVSAATKKKTNSYSQEEVEEQIDKLVEDMTYKEKAAQMILVAAPSDAASVQKKYQFGGYVFFANDFSGTSKTAFKSRIKGIQKASKIPMLIAVDEEGGTVVRVSKY